MQPIETITAISDDLLQALAIWDDNVRAQLSDPDQDWKLVSMQIIPSMRPVTLVNGLIGPQEPQMKVVIIIVGIFQLHPDIFSNPSYAKMVDNTNMVLEKAKEQQRLRDQEDCDHQFGEDGKCIHCDKDVKTL